MKRTTTSVLALLASVALASSALATMEINKEYKAKKPDAKCDTCHVSKMPKKEPKEASERNAFGKTVEAAKGKDGKIDWSKVK